MDGNLAMSNPEAEMKMPVAELWRDWHSARSILCQQQTVLEAGCVDWSLTKLQKATAIRHLESAINEITTLLRLSGSA